MYADYAEQRKQNAVDRGNNKQASASAASQEGLDADEGEIGVSLVHVSSK